MGTVTFPKAYRKYFLKNLWLRFKYRKALSAQGFQYTSINKKKEIITNFWNPKTGKYEQIVEGKLEYEEEE